MNDSIKHDYVLTIHVHKSSKVPTYPVHGIKRSNARASSVDPADKPWDVGGVFYLAMVTRSLYGPKDSQLNRHGAIILLFCTVRRFS